MSNFFNKIKNIKRPYIIAELGSNHNGDMKIAEQLIKKAKKAGADCVKFQSWTSKSIFSKIKYKQNYFLKDDYRKRTDYSLEDIVKKFSISQNQLYKMMLIAKKNKIDFASTPFSNEEVNYLVKKLKPPFIKIASMDLNNYQFLEYVAKKNIPIVLSTGLSDLHEIDKAIKTIESTGNKKIVILHCVAIYPSPDTSINLRNIETLKKIYPYPIGFSDHSIGFSIPLAATSMGVSIIEKHFTLDKAMFGWDHKVSCDYKELKIICEETKRISKSLGSSEIKVQEDSIRINEFRRSIVAKKPIKKGSVIKSKDVTFKRPGWGIEPEFVEFIINRKAKNNISKDTIIRLEDLV
tara:strand:- start:866 stop:1915 length:1050 start_codon:yes stop_codon:yes gene_type:complete